MKKQIYMVAAFLSLSVVPFSTAQANNLDMRPYMGVGMGLFGLEYKDSAISQRETGFGGFIKGGVDIGDYFGVEMRVGTTSEPSKSYAAGSSLAGAGTFKTSATFVSYLGKVQMPVSNELRPYVLLGGTSASFKSTNSVTGGTGGQVKAGISYGVGLDYNLGNQLSANIEWMQYWNNVKLGTYGAAPTGATNSKAKIWGLVAGVDYHF